MRTRLGINYGTMNGIHLGGDNTSGTAEAEICWNCHRDIDGPNAYGVSEWGYNTKTTPSGYPVVLNTAPASFPTQHDGTADRVDQGQLFADGSYLWTQRTTDWTAGYWMEEYDNTIRRRIASVHSASFDPAGQSSSVSSNVDGSGVVNRTSPTLEDKSYIRCAYCHDVHGLRRAQGAGAIPPAAPAALTKPFLRGTWVGDPYPPELPPRPAYSYPAGQPRNRSSNRDRGGYFIDQNSGWPTDNPAMNTLSLTAGLCTLCHWTNVDTMKFYTGSTLWLPGMVNGHSNSTLGGTRVPSIARDIFSASRGNVLPAEHGMGEQMGVGGGTCSVGANSGWRPCVTNGNGCDLCCVITNDGWYGGVNPPYLNSCTLGGGDYSNWFGTGTIGGAKGPGSMAHKFTCSKCHSPHAAGLPALLTHNCIDAALTTYGNAPDLRADNCHRKTTTLEGWHKLAPGQ